MEVGLIHQESPDSWVMPPSPPSPAPRWPTAQVQLSRLTLLNSFNHSVLSSSTCLARNCALYGILFTIIYGRPTVYRALYQYLSDTVLVIILQGKNYSHIISRQRSSGSCPSGLWTHLENGVPRLRPRPI